MSLSYANVKTFKAIRGIREALIDITLDGSYVNGGWTINAAAVKDYSGIASIIYDLNPPSNRGGYGFEWDQVNGKLKAIQGAASQGFEEAAWAEFTAYPAGTFTTQGAAFMKVYSVAEADYCNCAVSNASFGDTYAADFQIFPDADADAIGDAVFFGDEVKFGQIGIDVTTGMTWSGTPVLWEYYNADGTWDTLTIVVDNSSSTGTTGITSFEQDGVITFVPPQDWGSVSVDGQAAYWVRAKLGAAGVTTPCVMADEWELNVLTTGYVPIYDGVVNAVTIHDGAGTMHTTADIKFFVQNYTTGRCSEELTFIMDVHSETIKIAYPIPVSIGDKLGVIITQEDATNEAGVLNMVLHYSGAEALAGDANLNSLVVRCHVVGS